MTQHPYSHDWRDKEEVLNSNARWRCSAVYMIYPPCNYSDTFEASQ